MDSRHVTFDLYIWKSPRDLDADQAEALLKGRHETGGDPANALRAEHRCRVVLPRAHEGPTRARMPLSEARTYERAARHTPLREFERGR